MSKVTEFRVWDGKRMYYFDPFYDKGNFTLSYNDTSGWNVNIEPAKPKDKWICGSSSDVSMEMIQYTGLEDKNGKRIYEGDIVQVFRKGFMLPCVVRYTDLCAFEVQNPTWSCGVGWYKPKDIEVIGNIYENPELIKEDNQ